MRNRASEAFNSENRSLKSGFTDILHPPDRLGFANHFPGRGEAPFRADPPPELDVKRPVVPRAVAQNARHPYRRLGQVSHVRIIRGHGPSARLHTNGFRTRIAGTADLSLRRACGPTGSARRRREPPGRASRAGSPCRTSLADAGVSLLAIGTFDTD